MPTAPPVTMTALSWSLFIAGYPVLVDCLASLGRCRRPNLISVNAQPVQGGRLPQRPRARLILIKRTARGRAEDGNPLGEPAHVRNDHQRRPDARGSARDPARF